MKISIIFFLVLTNLCFSQNINSIKNADTIYVYFKGKIGENKRAGDFNASYGPITTYEFILNKEFELRILSSKYLNFDDYEIGKLADKRVEQRKFLKIHKDAIITYKFLRNILQDYSKEDIYNWIQQNIKNKKKVFYLIDKEKNESGKVFLFKINSFIESYEPPWNDVEPLEIKIINTDSVKN